MLFVFLAAYGRLVFLPLELEGLRGLSALRVGLLFLPAAAAQAIGMQFGGRLVDRIGARLPMIVGCAMMLAAVTGFARLTLSTPVAVIGVFLSLQGFGVGLISPAATVAGLSDLPRPLLAQGTALRSLSGQVAGALSVAVLGAIVSIRMGPHPTPAHAQAAYNAAFSAAAGAVLLGFVLTWRMPKQSRERVGGEAMAFVPE
jgi:MFS family permease